MKPAAKLLTITIINSLDLLSAFEYKETNLKLLCDGRKQSLYLHNHEPQVFKYNSSNKDSVYCHLELHLKSEEFGFSVFIQSLNTDPDCNKDFLQFGRFELL